MSNNSKHIPISLAKTVVALLCTQAHMRYCQYRAVNNIKDEKIIRATIENYKQLSAHDSDIE